MQAGPQIGMSELMVMGSICGAGLLVAVVIGVVLFVVLRGRKKGPDA